MSKECTRQATGGANHLKRPVEKYVEADDPSSRQVDIHFVLDLRPSGYTEIKFRLFDMRLSGIFSLLGECY